MVIKHSERTPLCGDALVQAFDLAGAPKGLVQALHCDHKVTRSVIQHPSTGFVSFTGSVTGGRAVFQAAAAGCETSQRFIDTTVELGGKDALYVAEDADLDIPKCRQCRKVICRSCAKNWQNSNLETGKKCPFCRVRNYLDDYVFQRTQLRNAGFINEERNSLILRQVSGDVHQAIAVLLEEQDDEDDEEEVESKASR